MHAPFEVRIGGDGDYELDLDGSSAWGCHSFNCTPVGDAGRRSGCMFTQTLICNDKVNDGAYFALQTNFPPGLGREPRRRRGLDRHRLGAS